MAASRRLVFLSFAALCGAILASIETLTSAAVLYLPDPGWPEALLALLSMGVAGMAMRRASKSPSARSDIPNALMTASIAVSLGGASLFYCFSLGSLPVVARAAPIAGAAALGAVVGSGWAALAKPALALGTVGYFANPLRLFLFFVALGAWLGTTAHLGPFHQAALTASALSILAFSLAWPLSFIHGGPLWRKRAASLVPLCLTIVNGLLLRHSMTAVSLAEHASYPDPVVYAEGTVPRYVVTTTPAGFELFIDHQIALSSTDGHRYAEALVAPALASASRPRRVLLLGVVTGLLAGAVLRDRRVSRLTVVTPDPVLVRLARTMRWSRTRDGDVFADPRLAVVYDEAVPWLASSAEAFDVIIVNAGAPTDYRVGKIYTVYAMRLLRERLTEGGVAVIPAASALRSPEAHATIAATARAAGMQVLPYHAPIVTLGEWSILLASASEAVPRQDEIIGDYLTPGEFAATRAPTPDREARAAAPSTLHAQAAVEAFRREQHLD
jgi:predicted membrane-bound spermidine synthase